MSSTGSSCNVKLKTSGISTYILYDIVRISIFEKEEETSLGRLFSHIKNKIFLAMIYVVLILGFLMHT